MRVVFLCRDGLAARYVAHELRRAHPLAAVVVETGKAARRRKLARSWERTPWWRVPLLALDLVALATYGRLWATALRRRLRDHPAADGWPDGIERHRFDDANEEGCVALLRRLEPDVLVVLGTAILGPEVLDVPRVAALNIHGGLVPGYRNVHSEVWAVVRGRPADVGTSILHVDSGIDSGAVALQKRVVDTLEGAPARGFFDLRWRNVELGARLAVEAVRLVAEGTLPREPQDDASVGFHPTPGLGTLVRLLRARGSVRALER